MKDISFRTGLSYIVAILFFEIVILSPNLSMSNVDANRFDEIIELVCDDNMHTIVAGEETEYNIIVMNQGSSSVDLNITTQDSFPPSTGVVCFFEDEVSWFPVSLEPCQSYLFSLYVTSTINAHPGEYIFPVEANQQQNHGLLVSIDIFTIIIPREYGIDLNCLDNNETICPEETVQYYIDVTNLGNVPDDFRFSIGGWAYGLEGVSTALILPDGSVYPEGIGNPTWHFEANETDMITLNVTVIYTSGSYDINVTGVSLSKPNLSDTIETLTTMNHPPNPPNITGPNIGRPRIKHSYTIITTDPDSDDIYLYISWGDNSSSGWIGPFTSGEEVVVYHTWCKKGVYIIKVKAIDKCAAESDWAILEVSMPMNELSCSSLFHSFIYRFIHSLMVLKDMLLRYS